MARPTRITLTSKEQKAVLSMLKKTTNARAISEDLGLSRLQVMAFLESKKLSKYSDGSYC